jgi:signal transduction histidine kinase
VGRAEHAYESVDVKELLGEVKGMLALPSHFSVTWRDDLPTVVTQRTLLAQVFMNLIGNAAKHHDLPSGKIEVSAEDQDSFVLFRVRDDGPGIAEKDRSKVFGLFTTLKRRDEVEGSGMGLAFVQKVVRQLGGQVEAVGPDGRGITFQFSWPKGPTARKQKKTRPPTLVGFKYGGTE